MDWRRQALAFFEQTRAGGLSGHPQVLAALAGQAAGGESYGVACSGGADSLALLLWLHGAAQAGVFDVGGVKVLHLNHNLRGADSAGDAAFVAEVALALGWSLYAETLAKREHGQASPSEEFLRRARQAFFGRSGCSVIFQGHHLGDVAETMLMRLAAGSGLDGLAAPRAVSRAGAGQPLYVRPLLGWRKADMVRLLEGLGIRWREDASNARGDYFRNRVRLDVLPALEQAAGGRDVLAGAGRSRSQLQEDVEALDAWLDAAWRSALISAQGGQLHNSSWENDLRKNAETVVDRADVLKLAPLDPLVVQMSQSAGRTDLLPVLDWRIFAPLPRAIRRRALWRLLGFCAVAGAGDPQAGISGAAVDGMLDAFESAQGALTLSAGKNFFVRYLPDSGELSLVDAVEVARSAGGPLAEALQVSLPLATGQAVVLPCGGQVSAQRVLLNDALRRRILGGQVDCRREAYLKWPETLGAAVAPAAGNGSLAGADQGLQRSGVSVSPAVNADAFDCAKHSENAEGGSGFSAAAAVQASSVFPADAECGAAAWALQVRFWQAGDRYRPLGAPGRRKLHDVFTDKKVPAAQRSLLPVVADAQSGALLWVAALPPAHEYALGVGTKWALWLTYTPACKTVTSQLLSDERRTTTD